MQRARDSLADGPTAGLPVVGALAVLDGLAREVADLIRAGRARRRSAAVHLHTLACGARRGAAGRRPRTSVATGKRACSPVPGAAAARQWLRTFCQLGARIDQGVHSMHSWAGMPACTAHPPTVKFGLQQEAAAVVPLHVLCRPGHAVGGCRHLGAHRIAGAQVLGHAAGRGGVERCVGADSRTHPRQTV